MKKILTILLSACMLLTSMSLPVYAAESTVLDSGIEKNIVKEVSQTEAESPSILTESGDGEVVTRLQWLTALTETFEMTVEEENYPDNYYSDIDATHANYYEIMLATEFGLVDVEAGEALRPDDAATREYAAHTLNLCLGYSLEEGSEYTFTEKDTATYPGDIQIAIDKGWFTLQDGAFLPDSALTVAEKDAMLAHAQEVLSTVVLDENHENTYTFAEGVIVLPQDAQVMLTDEEEITITNCSITLVAGDIFAVVQNGLPIARRVVSVATTDTEMVVQVESVDLDEAFTELDIQGEMEVDLSQVQAVNESVSLAYVVGGSAENKWEDGTKYDTLEAVGEQEISAVMATQSYVIPEAVKKEYNIAEGVTADITCTISKVTPTYDASLFDLSAYFKVNATMTFTCNVSVDVLKAMGVAPSIQLARVPIGIVGYVTAELELSFKGSLTLTLVEKITVGIQFEEGDFRLIKDFQKESFTIQAKVEAAAGVKLTMGFDVVFLKGSIYGRVGAKSVITLDTYDDGQAPDVCIHVNAWMYADVGAKIKVDLGIWEKSWSKTYDIYTKKNSPVKVVFHYEDGHAVSSCTRDGEAGGSSGGSTGGTGSNRRYNYYTPITSQYGYSGASTGVDAGGNTYTIFEYDLDEENNATITSYNGNVSALSIPDTLDGYTVTGIGEMVFKGQTQLRVVVIPDTVTNIGAGAFGGCINLENVILPNSLIEMGAHAFYNCDSLVSIEIPKNLAKTNTAYIYEFAYDYQYGPFYGCDGLKNIRFQEGTTVIAEGLFANCPGIEKIEMPDTITSIGQKAFFKCDNLAEVRFSESLTGIGDMAFAYCTALEKVDIPDSVVGIGAGTFGKCTNLSNVTLPDSLTQMSAHAFYDCDKLVSIEIPKNLAKTNTAYIYEFAYDYQHGPFYGCDGLKNVTFQGGTAVIAEGLFANCPGIEKIEMPDTITSIGQKAFFKCDNLAEVRFSGSLTGIGDMAFAYCTALEKVDIPDSVVGIGAGTFGKCTNLSNVTLPDSLTQMSAHAFYDCDKLVSVEIPKNLSITHDSYIYEFAYDYQYGPFYGCDGLKNVTFQGGTTVIAQGLFANCSGIEKIVVPNTVTAIGEKAFYNCDNLKEVIVSDTVTSMETYIFAECAGLQKVVLPQGQVNIGVGTFKNCPSLTDVNISDTVTYIREYAFYNTGLTNVALPDSVVSIERYAFGDCAALESFSTGAELTTIGESAFRNCSVLSSMVLKEKVTSIGAYSFQNCDALTSITIPDATVSIGTYAFEGCEVLSDVNLGAGLTSIPAYAFNLCPALQKITIPYRVTTINNNAFTNCTNLTEVIIPRATTSIGTSVFSYPTQMTIYGIAGTYAEEYAALIGANFVVREINATKVSLSAETLNLNKGQTATLVLTVEPADFTDEVSWKSTDTSVATIDGTGKVTAKAVGTATIKVTVGSKSASCKVTVVQPVTSIGLSASTLTMEAGEEKTITATVYPTNANNKQIVWSSSDESVAIVDQNGKVTALKKGTAEIKATAQDGSGVSRSCVVTVTNNVIICTDVAALESPHDYEVNCSDVWIYTLTGAKKIVVTFDAQTNVEEDFDYIYIYDKDDIEIGKYTGTELAGQNVAVTGDTVKIKLVSDDSGTAWGFKVTSIVESNEKEPVTEVFDDIKASDWWVNAVQFVYDNDIMAGKNESFDPAGKLTREQFVQVLYNHSGTPAVTIENKFPDVKSGQWYYNAVLWANANDIANGRGDGTFGVGKNISRQDLALMLYKYARLNGYDIAFNQGEIEKYSDDAMVSEYAKEAMNWAVTQGIMSGKGKVGEDISTFRLDPLGTATRAECASMMMKLIQKN